MGKKAKRWNKPNIFVHYDQKILMLSFKKITAFSMGTLQKEVKGLKNMK